MLTLEEDSLPQAQGSCLLNTAVKDRLCWGPLCWLEEHPNGHPFQKLPTPSSKQTGAQNLCLKKGSSKCLDRGSIARQEKMACPCSLKSCFSTSVARLFAKLVRPPVQVYGIKGSYVVALYSAASKQNKLEQVEKELLRVAQILKEPKIAALILNPFAKHSVKEKSLSGMTSRPT